MKSASTALERTPDEAAITRTPRSPLSGELLLYLLLASLTLAAWLFSRTGWLHAGDNTGYWIGVAGGLSMLALFTYPLRKHLRFMQRLGPVKWWFWAHMTLGIAGPLLILVHSGFRVGSLNAGVALYSMLVVAGSGVVGRFLYVRIHRGLDGELTSLRELQWRAGFVESEARSRLHFAPEVEQRLLAFEHYEPGTAPGWSEHLRKVMLLPLRQWLTYRRCVAELRAPLRELARQRSWNDDELARRERHARRLVQRYLNAVVRVDQFVAYQRVFALWHMAHVPFVYLMVFSAVVHVIAVHAY